MKNANVGFAKRAFSGAIEGGNGCRRPLEINAFAVLSDRTSVVILAMDLIHLSNDRCRKIQERCAERLSLPRESILVHISHTHSSPPFRKEYGKLDIPRFIELAVGCAAQAVQSARPTMMKTATTDVGKSLSIHRRGNAGSGLGIQTYWFGYRWDRKSDRADASPLSLEMSNRWLKKGPAFKRGPKPVWFAREVDPLVQAMLFQDIDGQAIGSIVRFAAHPHITSALRKVIADPDYPARVRKRMEKEYNCPCVFLVGPCANLVPKEHISYVLNTKWHPGYGYFGPIASLFPESDKAGLAETDRIGRTIAETAIKELEKSSFSRLTDVRFTSKMFPVEFDRTIPTDKDTIIRMRDLLLSEYEGCISQGGPLSEIRRIANLLNRLEWAPRSMTGTLSEQEMMTGRTLMAQSALRLNDSVFAFMHSEIPVETTLRLRKKHPHTDLWTVALTEGSLGYIPTDAMMNEGGYEGRTSIIARDTEVRIGDNADKLIRRVGFEN